MLGLTAYRRNPKRCCWLALNRPGQSQHAPSSVRKDHNYLHSALKQAVRLQILATNPADFVVPPRVTRAEMKVLDETQSAAMLRAAESTDQKWPGAIGQPDR